MRLCMAYVKESLTSARQMTLVPRESVDAPACRPFRLLQGSVAPARNEYEFEPVRLRKAASERDLGLSNTSPSHDGIMRGYS